jgi:hypothetical protein
MIDLDANLKPGKKIYYRAEYPEHKELRHIIATFVDDGGHVVYKVWWARKKRFDWRVESLFNFQFANDDGHLSL